MKVDGVYRMREASPVRPLRVVVVREILDTRRVLIAWTAEGTEGETTLVVDRRLIDRHGVPVRRRAPQTGGGS